MNIAEATRQYQATLEAARRLREEFEHIVSADDILAESTLDVAQARDVMNVAWLTHTIL